MDKLEFKKGTLEFLDDCIKAMENSSMCTSYFESLESRGKAVMEGIESGDLYVALYNEDCAGFGFMIREGAFHAFHYLHLFAIKKEYRSKGIGKKLLDYIENKAFETADKIFLVVGDYNPKARRFYEKNEYCFIGTLPGLYRKGINEHLMMKTKK
ncbi:MAG: GNAT family N-acetyltransferase [Spirochaetes bacterium]|jgi:ribosomal protein S18 acetylase RimI-like enzyme|nr:GNAT family N-acetyltransferase [Spirochaetota bacterium]